MFCNVIFSAKPKLQINLIKSTVICPKEEREQLKAANTKAYYQLEKDATGSSADVINEQVKVADATSEEATLQERIGHGSYAVVKKQSTFEM